MGRLSKWLVTGIVFAAFWLLTPIIEFLLAQLQGAVAKTPQLQWGDQPPPDPLQPADISRQMALLRYCLSAGVIVTALVLALLFFARSVARLRRSEDEETDLDSAGLRPGRFGPGRFGVNMTRLRNWLALLGRYGAGSRLLDAVTVENIYANLVRLARRKGFPPEPKAAKTKHPMRTCPNCVWPFPRTTTNSWRSPASTRACAMANTPPAPPTFARLAPPMRPSSPTTTQERPNRVSPASKGHGRVHTRPAPSARNTPQKAGASRRLRPTRPHAPSD